MYANKDVKLNSTEIWWFTEAGLLFTAKSNIAIGYYKNNTKGKVGKGLKFCDGQKSTASLGRKKTPKMGFLKNIYGT